MALVTRYERRGDAGQHQLPITRLLVPGEETSTATGITTTGQACAPGDGR